MKRLSFLNFPFSILAVALVSFLFGCSGTAQTPYSGTCRRIPKLELTSLTMIPDPLPEARKIDQWRAIIRSDSSDLCQATLAVVEAETDKPVTPEREAELSLGTNEIILFSHDDYRLSGKEICFEISADMNGNKLTLSSPKRFCARTIDRGWWSMR